MLASFVTDDGTFADPQFDGRALLRPAQGPAQSTDAWPRGQQHRTLRQRRDRLRWLLVSQSLGPFVVGRQLGQLCTCAGRIVLPAQASNLRTPQTCERSDRY